MIYYLFKRVSCASQYDEMETCEGELFSDFFSNMITLEGFWHIECKAFCCGCIAKDEGNWEAHSSQEVNELIMCTLAFVAVAAVASLRQRPRETSPEDVHIQIAHHT